jgi:predicted nucleotidyltransferase
MMVASVNDFRRMLQPLSSDKTLQLVILFGSTATGKRHGGSDIDIAVLYDHPADIVSLTTDVMRLMKSNAVDVVDLRRASPLLRFAVVSRGILLYEREPGMFHAYSSLAFRRYVDTKKLRDAQATSIKTFLGQRALA